MNSEQKKDSRKAPAFQLFADDFLSGTAEMTTEEVGAYIRLLCHQWTKGGLPNDQDRLARMAGPMALPSLCYVIAKFLPGDDGLLRHPRLEKIRAEQEEFRRKKSHSGSLGAKNRWQRCQTDGNAIANPLAEPMANDMANDSSPSPSPIITTKEYVPSEVEIEKEETKREANTILETLNEVSGRKFRLTDTNLGLIQARLKEPGVDLEGMLKMVRRQAAIWMPDPKMSEYVRPETLFGKKKFDSYYGSRELPIPKNQQQQETQTYPKGYEWMADKRDWRHAL